MDDSSLARTVPATRAPSGMRISASTSALPRSRTPVRGSLAAPAAAKPGTPMLPPLRATTAHGPRINYLPTPPISPRMSGIAAINAKIDLRFPSHGKSLSGWALGANNFGSQAQLLLSAHESASAAGAAQDSTAGAAQAGEHAAEEARKRARRAEKARAVEREMQSLMQQRKSIVDAGTQAKAGSSGGDPKAAAEAARKAAEAEAHRLAKEAFLEAKRQAGAKTPTERIELRLLELRADENARLELDRKCEEWKAARSDGKHEQRDFILENRKYTRSLSTTDIIQRKKEPYGRWQHKRVGVQQRLDEMQRERDLVRQALEEQQLRMMRESMRFGSPSASPRPGTSAGGGKGGAADEAADDERGPMSEALLKHLPPRERAQLLRLEMERRRRWAVMVVVAAHASRWLDDLVWARNNRHLKAEQYAAARIIQRNHASKSLRKNLEKLGKSMGCLRKNVGVFCLRWKIRNKVRSGDTIRQFLEHVKSQAAMTKLIHNFVYMVVKLQRAWRRHASIIHSQLGIFAVQFDRVLETKKNPLLFLTDDQRKRWMQMAGDQMLEASKKDTRAGQHAAKKAAIAEEAAAEAGAEQGGAVAAAPAPEAAAPSGKGKGKGKGKGGQGEAPSAADDLPAFDGQFLQVDLDCKVRVLSQKLLARKKHHRKAMREYEFELEAHQKLVQKQREMEQARQLIGNDGGAEQAAAVAAASGVTDLVATVGDFASMVRAKPPPRTRLTLAPHEVVDLIQAAMLATAEKIQMGQPIDAHRSVRAQQQRKKR